MNIKKTWAKPVSDKANREAEITRFHETHTDNVSDAFRFLRLKYKKDTIGKPHDFKPPTEGFYIELLQSRDNYVKTGDLAQFRADVSGVMERASDMLKKHTNPIKESFNTMTKAAGVKASLSTTSQKAVQVVANTLLDLINEAEEKNSARVKASPRA